MLLQYSFLPSGKIQQIRESRDKEWFIPIICTNQYHLSLKNHKFLVLSVQHIIVIVLKAKSERIQTY